MEQSFNGYLFPQGIESTASKQYVKASIEEDNILIEAAHLFGRNDYNRILSHIERRLFVLPVQAQQFYRSASGEKKRDRIYRRMKQIFDYRKTIENEWVPVTQNSTSTSFQNSTSTSIQSSTSTCTNVDPAAASQSRMAPQVTVTPSTSQYSEQDNLYNLPEQTSPRSVVRVLRDAQTKDAQEKKRKAETGEEEQENGKSAVPKKKQCMKDLRKDNAKMMNEALRSFPTMMSSMMEMMERERKEDRRFKRLLLKHMSKDESSDDD